MNDITYAAHVTSDAILLTWIDLNYNGDKHDTLTYFDIWNVKCVEMY